MLKISERKLFFVQFLITAIPLSLMYLMEHVWNYKPCHLCIYQRYPYFIIIFLSLIGYLFYKKTRIIKIIAIFCCFAWIGSSGLAFYHSGVEHNIFESTSCKTNAINNLSSFEEMHKYITETKSVDCKNPEFRILGWSLAELNFIFSSLIFIILTYNSNYLLRRKKYE